jgi:hypothetical protein
LDNILDEIGNKEIPVEDITGKVIKEPGLLPVVIEGFSAKKANIKFKSAKILVQISRKEPGLLYDYFDFFAEQLSNKNNILKWSAIDILANLTPVDTQEKFDKLVPKYHSMLYEGSLITAGHVIAGSGVIVKSKPYLEDKITASVLDIENIPLPTEECRNIAKGHAITVFGDYFNYIGNKARVIEFIRKELNNTRNSTRKKAEKFLTKWAK